MAATLKWDPNMVTDEERRQLPEPVARMLDALDDLPAGEYALEEVVTLSDEDDAAAREGIKQAREGKTVTMSEVKRRLGL